MRSAYRCRAYPDEAQQQALARTFGCVRLVWNRTLAARHPRWHTERQGTSYAQADRALTIMKRDPGLEFLNEVSAVPLQQALRHQEKAFRAFFEKRARYPRFKSRRGRQCAAYTRAAFRMRAGDLWLAKTGAPLRYVWTWPDIDPATLDPTSVTVVRDPAGRWFVTFHVDIPGPEPLPATGKSVGVDAGLTHFAALSTGEKIGHPKDGWPARSPAPGGVSTAGCWSTKPAATGGRSPSWTAGIRARRPAQRAGTCSPPSASGHAAGRAPPAAPGTTGTSTPPRTSWPPGWR